MKTIQHERMKPITIGSRTFVNKRQFIDTLFDDSTASGHYLHVNHGIEFYDLRGELFAFLCCGPGQRGFFVSARQTSHGKWYMYSTSELAEEKLGLNELTYSEAVALGERLSNWHKNRE